MKTEISYGKLYTTFQRSYATPLTVSAIPESEFVGRSNIVGKPLAALMLRENATVTIAHSRSKDLGAITRGADLLVAAVGSPGLITPEMVTPGTVIIDVGVNRVQVGGKNRLVGDVQKDAYALSSAYTPVPGGVGPLTVSHLLLNTALAARGLQEGK